MQVRTLNRMKILIGSCFTNVLISFLNWLVNSSFGRSLVRLTSCQYRKSRTTACTSSVIAVNSSTAMDKRFCWGDASEQTGDLAHYTSGNHLSVFAIKGIRCGALICHDYRYPELYREYKRRGVQLMFHSYHAAHISAERFRLMEAAVGQEHHAFSRGTTYPGITMPATMIAAAASSHLWISCPNSSARESCWGSFFVRADGVITGQLERHSTDLLLSTVDTEAGLYDSTLAWRDRALAGILHSGSLVQNERSDKCTDV
jgi:deaminated glutathione amidase